CKNEEYREDLKLVAESQKKLQEEARTLSERMVRRALTVRNEDFQKLSENLKKAVEAMTPAYEYLDQEKPSEAMRPEQEALQYLMRAESYFREIQVARASNSGGGGSQSGAQELENLFELELDQLKNQYETLQQQQNRRADAELDEARRRLEELARRQQQLVERARQAVSRGAQGGGGSPRSEQMQLQEEIQKLARQLERLSREKQNEELAQASRRLQQAARDMQNSAQGQQSSGDNQGTRALNRINDARRLMDRFREDNLNNDVKRLQERAAELNRRQEDIRSDLEKLAQSIQGLDPTGDPSRGVERPRDVAERILREKQELKQGLNELQQGLHDAARRAAAQQKESGSRKLQSAANYLRDEGLSRRIDQAREMIRRGMVDSARRREDSIQESLSGLGERMADVERSLQEAGGRARSPQERLEDALNRTGDLVSDLEAMRQRALEQQRRQERPQGQGQERSAQDQRAQRGQKGEEGQERQEGQRGQEGQQGQSGQEGETGQPGRGRPGTDQGQPGYGEQHAGGPAGGRDAVNFGERTPGGGGARLTPDQMRQFEKEYQLRLREGQDLARQLRDRRDLAAQVNDILKRMKSMPPSRMLEDPDELARLQKSVIEGFRDLELKLSRELNQEARRDNVRLAKDEEVPEEYRKQVEDYYRALAERAE
ncbi:MAG TPA: hypothetical protein PLP42_07390, partial [Acidobacteriota bacterium]|nr:hypothetical protein [Acidobacteriota bacterium]